MNHIFFKLVNKTYLSDIISFLKITENDFEKLNHFCDFSTKSYEIRDFTSLDKLKKNALSFMSKKPTDISSENFSVCLVNKNFDKNSNKNIIKIPVQNPRKSFSEVINNFCEKKTNINDKSNLKNQSIIYESVKIGKNFEIGNFSEVKSNVVIGDNVVIGNGVTIAENCIIGNNSIIENGVQLECSILNENVTISQNSVVGKNGFGFIPSGLKTKVFFHIGGVVIGKNTYVGANSNIDRGLINDTIIGDSVMIDNQVHIAHNCKIDDFCILPGKCALSGSVHLEKNVILGGGVGIVDNVVIGEGSTITAGSNVLKSFPIKNSKIGGYPALNHYDWQRIQVLNNKKIRKRLVK